MCGITGIWNYKSGRPIDRDRLQQMTTLLSHRGPDGDGFYCDSSLGLGHRRLSIIDVEGGRQPMCNEDRTVWITFNGEIYNFQELRGPLLERGHVFTTHCDTEVIVHLYEELGPKCFEKLRGMFALALWDSRKQQLILARDRIGIKPLHYGLFDDGIVFASELNSIRAATDGDLAIDYTAIADVFTYFHIPSPKTIYRDVYSLEPGHYLVVDGGGIRKQKYWDLEGEPVELENESAYEGLLYDILKDSVRGHLVSDVPVGAFLSGGLDSSAVVAMMSQLMGDAVSTCSIGFDEEKYNELPRARTVARLFATDHHEKVVTPEPAKVLEKLTEHYGQPFPDHSCIPTYYVSKLARERVKVVLSGDGGDENFAGYDQYRRQKMLEPIRRSVPSSLRTAVFGSLGNHLQSLSRDGLSSRLARIFRELAVSSREGYLQSLTVADEGMRRLIFAPELQEQLAGYDPLDVYRRIYDQAPGNDPLSKMFYLDIKTYLVDDILTKVDRASMANSLEVRVPLLDHKLVEFAYALPLRYKLRGRTTKYLLRKTMQRHLPAGHLKLDKRGFSIPLRPWMRGALRDWVHAAIFETPETANFLNLEGVEQIWQRFQNGESQFSRVLAVILSLAISSRVWARSSPRLARETIVARPLATPELTSTSAMGMVK